MHLHLPRVLIGARRSFRPLDVRCVRGRHLPTPALPLRLAGASNNFKGMQFARTPERLEQSRARLPRAAARLCAQLEDAQQCVLLAPAPLLAITTTNGVEVSMPYRRVVVVGSAKL